MQYCAAGNNYTADDSNCSIFYQCEDINKVLYCKEGLAYDISTQGCNWASQVPGCEYLLPSLDGVDFSACSNETCHVPGECGFYYDCKTRARQPCAYGLVFSLTNRTCVDPSEVPGCEGYIPSPTPVPVPEKNCYQPKKP